MTFTELEKKCKKRKFFRFIIFAVLIIIISIILFVLYKNFRKNKKTTVQNSIKTHTIKKNVFKKTVKKPVIKKIKKVKKVELNYILDLNQSIPDIKNSRLQRQKIKKQPDKHNNAGKNNIIFKTVSLPSYQTCISLSKKYYALKQYKKALKWAKNANIQNKKLPESWIMSAKSLNKLGKKEESLKILKIYYNYYKNKEIKKLIRQISEKK